MKRITGLVLAAVLLTGIPLSACKKKETTCAHDVSAWETVVAPTCTKEGLQEGICGICYETLQQSIPVNPDAHTFGEWAVEKPTETEKGKATKTCAESSAHLLTLELPVLGDLAYESSITERPSAGKDGKRVYLLKNKDGDVQFENPVPATGIQAVRDAVELGSSAESVQYIRSASGTMGTQFIRPWDESEVVDNWGADAYMTQSLNSTVSTASTELPYDTGRYSNKLTLASGATSGGFAVNGNWLKDAFEGIQGALAVSAVRFWVYNNDTADHTYTLYTQMSGEKNAGAYTGTLTQGAWTEICITKAMWEEAANDNSGKYAKGTDADFYINNELKGTSGEAEHVFFVDGFRKTRLREVESYVGADRYMESTDNISFEALHTEYVYAGEYSDKVTLGASKKTGIISLNGDVLRDSLELVIDPETGHVTKTAAISTRFQIYNPDGVAHTYELYPQMTGAKTQGNYTGTLAPHAWTTVEIPRLMWEEAVADSSGKYPKGADGEIVITNTSSESGEKAFYVDYFNDLGSSSVAPHSYEFGDNYTHIYNGTDDCDRWYYIVEEENPTTGELEEVIYGLTNWDGDEDGKIRNDFASTNGSESYMMGSRMFLQFANDLGYFYGVEGALERLYNSARWSTNKDFKEWTESGVNGPVYCFSFGSIQNSGDDSGYFAVITVRFSLTAQFAVTDFQVEGNIYVNNSAQEAGVTALKTWEIDEEGIASVIVGQELGARYLSTIDFTQTLVKSGDVVPTNPHTPEKIFVDSFNVYYKGSLVTKDNPAEFAAGKSTGNNFLIDDILPDSAMEDYLYDGFSFYLRVEEDGLIVDKPIDANSMIDVGMSAYLDTKTNKFLLNAKQAGELVVIIKTKYAEKEVYCSVSERQPTEIRPSIYEYQNGGYFWNNHTSSSITIQNYYRGKPLYFRADVPPSEANYASAAYTVSITGYTETWMPVENVGESLTETSRDGQPVTQFVAPSNGMYIITMTSKLNESKTAMMIVYVVDPPAIDSIVGKNYTAIFQYPQPTLMAVSFTNFQIVEEGGVETKYTFHAVIKTQTNLSETMLCTYTIAEAKLVSVHQSGANLGYRFSLNESYDFVLTHASGFGFDETKIMQPQSLVFEKVVEKNYKVVFPVAPAPNTQTIGLRFSDLQSSEADGVTTYTVKATLSIVGGASEVLACTYKEGEETLTAVHESGESLGYELFLNDNLDLALRRPAGSGMEETVRAFEWDKDAA